MTEPNGKEVRFRARAEKQVSHALRVIRRVGNLSRRTSYEYTPEQVAYMFDTLRAELDATQARFSQSTQPQFTFEQ
jgi:hypothetical protein